MSQIDLSEAADAEAFGALAVRSGAVHAVGDGDSDSLTQAQIRTISEQALSLLDFASQAGARGNRIVVGGISFELRERGSSRMLSISTEKAAPQIIAIGTRGTAFASLTPQQMRQLRLNAYNPVLPKTHRSDQQKAKRESGRHQDALWADSCSWLTPRGGQFWIGTLDEAVAKALVRKAKITVKKDARTESLVAYLRFDFDCSQKLSQSHKIVAVEAAGGRIEVKPVRTENSNGYRNKRFLRDVLAIHIVGEQ
jgi:hypothetical protein